MLETSLESIESSLSKSGKLLGSLCSLGSKSLLSVGLGSLSSGGNELCLLLGEGVQFVHESLVGQSIGLGGFTLDDMSRLDISEDSLNLVGVYDSGEISTLHNSSVESVSLLLSGSLHEVSEDGVESSEGRLGVDNESTEVTSGSELQDVESVDVANIDTLDVSSGLGNRVIIVVDNEGTLSHDISRVSVFAFTSSDFAGALDLIEIVINTKLGEDLEEVGCLLGGRESINDKRELSDGINGVSSGHDERGAG